MPDEGGYQNTRVWLVLVVCSLFIPSTDAERHVAHSRWFVVFFVGSVHLPDIPRWLPAPRETGDRPLDRGAAQQGGTFMVAVPPGQNAPDHDRSEFGECG